MDEILQSFFNLGILARTWPFLVDGLWTTLLLCLTVIPVGLAGGIGVALLSTSRARLLRWPLLAAVDLFRSFPPLVLLMLIYSGLPFAGVNLPPFAAVVLAFLLNNAAFYGEIFRAGLESVPAGQMEAARSTGLTKLQAMLWVVLPQATRNVAPDLVSNTLEVAKLTAIASVVALPELLHAARSVQSLTYNATPLVAAGAIYLALLWPLVRLLSRLEHRMLAKR
ncbi:MAG: amino acid ABC transporter permease [Alphaproteobacteria bacterium]|nr:amino acid ABC transporter permease [Alphaproteobacteria bacterium]